MRRIAVFCTGRGRGEHPQRHIGTITDSRREVGDKHQFVAAATANLLQLRDGLTPEAAKDLAMGFYDVATRIGHLVQRVRLTEDQRTLYETDHDGLKVEETRNGRYFHFRCRTCGRCADVIESKLTRFVDALHQLRREQCDLAEISSTI